MTARLRQPQHVPASPATSPDDAAQIRALNAEVHELADRANAACTLGAPPPRRARADQAPPAQRFADYENEIRVLEAKLRQAQRKDSAPAGPDAGAQTPTPPRPGLSRFGSLMGSRRGSSGQNVTLSSARENELEARLVKEQTARIAAEAKVAQAHAEMEDLSATLFQQANEMVAAARRENATLRAQMPAQGGPQADADAPREGGGVDAETETENARLRARVRALEGREAERRTRLERLEAASRRIERARELLNPG